jgi:uncharacterized protein (TIGR00255 family)
MISSMTGFGQAECETVWGHLTIEARSENNRFREIQIRLPRIFNEFETPVRELLSEYVQRGSVYVHVNLKEGGAVSPDTAVNHEAVRKYVNALREIQNAYALAGEVSISSIAAMPDLWNKDNGSVDFKEGWEILRKPFHSVFSSLKDSRLSEGKRLEKALRDALERCQQSLTMIKKRAPFRLKEYRARLTARIEELCKNIEVDPNRVATEVALMAERLDIEEECIRLQSHFDEFNKTLKNEKTPGKRLNFLLQEMNREANTIGAKANDAKIGKQSLFLKEQIETMREQIQNIE